MIELLDLGVKSLKHIDLDLQFHGWALEQLHFFVCSNYIFSLAGIDVCYFGFAGL